MGKEGRKEDRLAHDKIYSIGQGHGRTRVSPMHVDRSFPAACVHARMWPRLPALGSARLSWACTCGAFLASVAPHVLPRPSLPPSRVHSFSVPFFSPPPCLIQPIRGPDHHASEKARRDLSAAVASSSIGTWATVEQQAGRAGPGRVAVSLIIRWLDQDAAADKGCACSISQGKFNHAQRRAHVRTLISDLIR